MRTSLLNRRIPTLLALLLLIGGIGTASYLANTQLHIISRASPEEKPQNMRITNVTDSAFTLTYTTSIPTLGTISYGTQEPSQVVFDDRDKKAGITKDYTTHSITVEGLKPETKYVFSITSGTSTFLDGDKPFTISTGPTLSDAPQGKTVTGTILTPDETQAVNILVYVTTANGEVRSTFTKADGAYTLSLRGLRSENLDSFLNLPEGTKMSLIAQSNTSTSQASFLLISPSLPDITLSQNYDFTFGRTLILPEVSSESATLSFPLFSTSPVENAAVAIDTPTNNEEFSDQQPRFSGTAGAYEEVEITIKSEERKVIVQADANGNWIYRPDTPLTPGEHSITIKTRDSRGILREITRSFVVFAEGSQFTEPSVSPPVSTITQSPTPTSQASPTPSTEPSPTREVTEEPTPSPTDVLIIPTAEPSPTLTPRPSIEPTGTGDLSAISLFSFAIMTLGVILLVFTKGIRV
ncbi:MAG: hypothetical protein HYV40_04290 [Candidatus Levybacteria bacterium]|nr:hypothetical protein [Candidatus Levybacteria bacterium]